MECEREEESGVMYSANKSGEYTPCGDMPNFTVQGLRDALTKAESAVMEPLHSVDEFIIQLEVTMADQPGRLHSPDFLWNGGMVQCVLKGDPALRTWSMCRWTAWDSCIYSFMTDMDIVASPKRRPLPCAHT